MWYRLDSRDVSAGYIISCGWVRSEEHFNNQNSVAWAGSVWCHGRHLRYPYNSSFSSFSKGSYPLDTEKPGSCPEMDQIMKCTPEMQENFCSKDSDCPGPELCCVIHCGRDCLNPNVKWIEVGCPNLLYSCLGLRAPPGSQSCLLSSALQKRPKSEFWNRCQFLIMAGHS